MKYAMPIVILTIAIFLNAGLLHAQPQPGGGGGPRMNPPSLVVQGSGEAWGKPDRVSITTGASAQSKTAAEAQDKVNSVIAQAIEKIKALGIPEDNIHTADLSIYPVMSDGGLMGEPKVTGYRANNTIRVRVDDLTKIGPVIDAAIEGGANEMHGLSFEIKNDTQLRNDALRDAAQDARQKAEALATGMGVRLGRVMEIIEGGATISPPMPYMESDMRMLAANKTVVQPGQQSVHASVTVRYSILADDGAPLPPPGSP